jgi:hypothetical protein
MNFLRAMLTFSVFGLLNHEKAAMEIALAVLSNDKQTLYTSTGRQKLHQTLCEHLIDAGAIRIAIELVESDAQSVEVWLVALTILALLSPFAKKFEALRHLEGIVGHFTTIICRDIESVDVAGVVLCVEQLNCLMSSGRVLPGEVIRHSIHILSLFIDSEVSTQRMHALTGLAKYGQEGIVARSIAQHFNEGEHLSLLMHVISDKFQPEYSVALGDILVYIVHFGRPTTDDLENIWRIHTVLPATYQILFFRMFARLVRYAREGYLNCLMACVMDEPITCEWYELFDSVAIALSQRTDGCDRLAQLDLILLHHVFESESDIRNRARESFARFPSRKPTKEEFRMAADRLWNASDDCYPFCVMCTLLGDDADMVMTPGFYEELLTRGLV